MEKNVIEFPPERIKKVHPEPKSNLIHVRPEIFTAIQDEIRILKEKYRLTRTINYGLIGLCWYLFFHYC